MFTQTQCESLETRSAHTTACLQRQISVLKTSIIHVVQVPRAFQALR